MQLTRILAAVFIVATVLAVFDTVAGDEIYRWVDENGVVHFGDQPAGQENIEKVDLRQRRPVTIETPDNQPQTDGEPLVAEPSYAEKTRQERTEKRQQASQKRKEIAVQCAHQRQLLARFEPHPRVMIRNEDGTVSRIDDNKRLQILADAKTYISENCDSRKN